MEDQLRLIGSAIFVLKTEWKLSQGRERQNQSTLTKKSESKTVQPEGKRYQVRIVCLIWLVSFKMPYNG